MLTILLMSVKVAPLIVMSALRLLSVQLVHRGMDYSTIRVITHVLQGTISMELSARNVTQNALIVRVRLPANVQVVHQATG